MKFNFASDRFQLIYQRRISMGDNINYREIILNDREDKAIFALMQHSLVIDNYFCQQLQNWSTNRTAAKHHRVVLIQHILKPRLSSVLLFAHNSRFFCNQT